MDGFWTNLGRFDATRIARWTAAAVLIAAASAKSYALIRAGGAGFTSLLIPVELAVGGWLMSNRQPVAALLATLLLFCAFTTVSSANLMRGAESCSCFGLARVTTKGILVLDFVGTLAIGLVLLSARRAHGVAQGSAVGVEHKLAGYGSKLFAMVSVLGGVMILAKPGVAARDPTEELSGIGASGVTQIVSEVLANIPDRARGQCQIIVYRHGCASCKAFLREVRTGTAVAKLSENSVLVDLDGGDDPEPTLLARGRSIPRLTLENVQSPVRVPTIISVLDAKVTSVTHPESEVRVSSIFGGNHE